MAWNTLRTPQERWAAPKRVDGPGPVSSIPSALIASSYPPRPLPLEKESSVILCVDFDPKAGHDLLVLIR
jgi:hypothetical protein